MIDTVSRIFSILLCALLAMPAVGQSTAGEIRSMLESRDRDIKAMLGAEGDISDAQREELRVVINGVIDFGAMGKAALGPHWDDLTPAQRDKFVSVFGEIVRHQSLSDLDVYRSAVTYDDIQVEGDVAHVFTTTTYKDIPTPVEYELIRSDDSWVARDIILDEVSTVGGYSRSFQAVIRKRGFDSLMQSLNKRLDSIRSES